MANKKDDTAKKIDPEIVSVYVNPYPDWTGKTIESKKYGPIVLPDGKIVSKAEFDKLAAKADPKGKKVRLDIQIPVPGTDEEAKELFNLSIADLIERGVQKHCYDERIITPLMNESAEHGVNMESEEFVSQVAAEMKQAMIYEEKQTKVSEAKKNKDTIMELYRKFGLDPATTTQDQLAEAIEKRVAEMNTL